MKLLLKYQLTLKVQSSQASQAFMGKLKKFSESVGKYQRFSSHTGLYVATD